MLRRRRRPGRAGAACRAATPGSARARTGRSTPPPSPVASHSLPVRPELHLPAVVVGGLAVRDREQHAAPLAGSATFGFGRRAPVLADLDLARSRRARGQVDVEAPGGRVVGRERERQQPALARRARRVIAVRSRNGVAWTTPSTISRTRPDPLGHEHARAARRGGAPAHVGDVNVPSDTSVGAAAAGAASARTSSSASRRRAPWPSASHPRRAGERPDVAGARRRPARAARRRSEAVPPQRAPHRARRRARSAARGTTLRARDQRPRAPRGTRHAADRARCTVARHASSARSATDSRRSRRTLRSPVTRARHAHARVSAGGGAGRAARRARTATGAPSTSRYTGPASETTSMPPARVLAERAQRPAPSSPVGASPPGSRGRPSAARAAQKSPYR